MSSFSNSRSPARNKSLSVKRSNIQIYDDVNKYDPGQNNSQKRKENEILERAHYLKLHQEPSISAFEATDPPKP